MFQFEGIVWPLWLVSLIDVFKYAWIDAKAEHDMAVRRPAQYPLHILYIVGRRYSIIRFYAVRKASHVDTVKAVVYAHTGYLYAVGHRGIDHHIELVVVAGQKVENVLSFFQVADCQRKAAILFLLIHDLLKGMGDITITR